MTVRVVTDTTACLSAATAEQAGVVVVPLHVSVTGRGVLGAREITPGEVADILRDGRARVSTSMPSPGEFAQAYRRIEEEQIVSVHLSGRMSGTVGSARMAAEILGAEGPGADGAGPAGAAGEAGAARRVEVVDSGVLGLAMGYAVVNAARAAEAGASVEEVVELVRRQVGLSRTWFYVDTLEHLRRGGRIGRAAALVGSALAIKPLLTIRGGEVHPEARVRTRTKALATLVDRAVAAIEEGEREGLRVAVLELGARDAALELAATLEERTGVRPDVAELDPITSVHVGPGTLGIVVAPTALPPTALPPTALPPA
ncbi:DegV family protein [Ornithinimicrobium sp. Y1847]|uniref:DegV family protein n=1 Tax=Ornithinimicrobium sp. Y1847 TaxID=3405419 RepID=UPI003B6768E1